MGSFARRVLLWIGAGVVFLVGIIMSVEVIPAVAVDPLVTPETAIPAFWINVIANVLVGVIILPAVVDGQIAIRHSLCLTLSFNHDFVDGVPAARFVGRIRELIESGCGLCESREGQGAVG